MFAARTCDLCDWKRRTFEERLEIHLLDAKRCREAPDRRSRRNDLVGLDPADRR
jgi:hypothetical protein